MKKYLIEEKKYYKASLHTHTTNSDGAMDPEEVKALYKKLGYNVVAYTDHTYTEDYNSRLTDEDFVAINGYECQIYPLESHEDYKSKETPVYHLCLYATDKTNLKMHGVSKVDFLRRVKEEDFEERKKHLFNNAISPVTYNVSSINRMIKEANDNGWIVMYNHPIWSLQSYKDYIWLKGLWALEIYNHGCYVEGYNDTNDNVLDDLSRIGEGVCAVATDDSHRWTDMGGGFSYIGAKELTYEAVIDAMKKKDIYASQGPTFDYIYIENGKAYIKCSEVAKINMITDSGVGAGCPDGEYFYHGKKIIKKNGGQYLEDGTIASGTSCLLDGV
jgi:hypothetical protein